MSKLSTVPLPERLVAGSALCAGAAVTVTGTSYGLSGPTGVGPGLFPVIAGTALLVAGGVWTARMLRGAPVTAAARIPPDMGLAGLCGLRG